MHQSWDKYSRVQGFGQLFQTLPSEKPLPARRAAAEKFGGLTEREVEVLRAVAQGLTDIQVAEQLVISHRIVHSHLNSIYSKLGITSRSAATRYAIEHDLAWNRYVTLYVSRAYLYDISLASLTRK
jgi:DNA-binding NarL/FixJ family response regulator